VSQRGSLYDFLQKVIEMDSKTGLLIDSWISDDEMPVSAALKVIQVSDPDYGLAQDEITDRDEFIRLALISDFEPVLRLPRKEPENDSCMIDYIGDTAIEMFFNIHVVVDSWLFRQYSFGIRRIMERVRDLALMHSAISSAEGKLNTRKRFEQLVASEFTERILRLVSYHSRTTGDNRYELKRKIGELNRRVLEARIIWERNAP